MGLDAGKSHSGKLIEVPRSAATRHCTDDMVASSFPERSTKAAECKSCTFGALSTLFADVNRDLLTSLVHLIVPGLAVHVHFT